MLHDDCSPIVLTCPLLSFQGYTIPLDKRLAADGRGLQTVHINENFAKLAEALYIADRKVGLLHFAECSCSCEFTSVYFRYQIVYFRY